MIGGAIVILGFVFIVMIHEGGHLLAAKMFNIKATKYFLGFGPTLWSFNKGETEYGIKAIPAGGFVKILGMSPMEEVDERDEERTYRASPFRQKVVVVMAGVATHFILAFLLIWIADVVIGQHDSSRPLLEISRVVGNADGTPSPALQEGLRPGDKIIAIDGADVYTWDGFTEILRGKPDEEVSLIFKRGDEVISVNPVLASRFDQDRGEKIGFLGVAPKFDKIREGPISGITKAIYKTSVFVIESLKGLWGFIFNIGDLFKSLWNDDMDIDETRPVSIIGIVQFGAVTQDAGFNITLELLAYISVFVGLVNALPLYPLDGGHLAVAIYEKVTGNHPDVRKLLPVAVMVVSFIIILGIMGVYFDIAKPLSFE
ncbi:MAG: RIP metalloprotease [Dehalococcoidia bacterium]|nr:RIP metalloprotease [Dehalococcoidia bacterium]MQF99241.1 RIP metalloprotease [SAR202 cluster bacterium]|tara:strand:+ start:5922 stop:7037 length:1116 start_codon:yes stop_codon:yes gene_type:complete